MPEQQNLVTLTIDGREVQVPRGTLVVEAAKQLNIEVPVFCYHHKLDSVGACRLCLVQISPGPPRPTTACTTPVAQGMVVQTNTPMAVSARADILEFELVNHPLDCPVCDKGGECPLQDYTFRHGYPVSRIDAPRVHFQKPIPLSQNIALDRERCVLCYRCTRYYDEVAWEQELTADHRGVRSFITSQLNQPLESVFSGNIIDLCPVGALTSRVWRFESRPWDMDHSHSVCSKCSVGCSVTLWQRRKELVRVTSKENDEIDEGWICDRGRFDYADVNDPQRPRVPQVGGRDSTWEEALQTLTDGIKGKKVGISLRQDVTNEELFLVSRLLQGTLRNVKVAIERRTSLPAPTGETLPIKEIDGAATIVVVASNTADDVPVVNLRIKKAVRHGARLLLVHPDDLDLDRAPKDQLAHVRYEAGKAPEAVAALAGHEHLAKGPVVILYGDGHGTEDGAKVDAAVRELAAGIEARIMPLFRGTNERGAIAAGLAGEASVLDGCQAVLCLGPPAGGRLPASAKFVAVWDHQHRAEHGTPDVFLPAASFAETQGSYTNVEGRVQFLRPILTLEPPLRETWEVLCDLGQRLGARGFDYTGIFPIQREAASAVNGFTPLSSPPAPDPEPTPVLYGPARP
ncbi:MAG TPA: 2Fe-2S iron-sulfur cluster-binding protein [Candidatus Dormibacteraeota bacterium]|nr:2Fe-2S iron-sulfur cluster-binding protein [Candidatus Dormibacteraeota bacterium]